MPAYLIAEIDVHDTESFARYRPLAAASIEKFGGRYLVRGGSVELLEGKPEPKRVVVLEFADSDVLRRWYRSDEYQEALKVRQAASTGRVFMVDGAG